MIVTKLQGGLGNQLFQWATTISFAKDNNIDYYFDLRYFNEVWNGNVTHWDFEIYKIVKSDVLAPPNGLPSLNRIVDNFHYRSLNDNSYLDGYWQTEKYFKHNREFILKELEISDGIKEYIFNKYPILNENTVSVHIRRGDYVNLSIHPVQQINYYKNGYDVLNDTNINVLVFSDDIEWCKENISFNNTTYIQEDNITDLYMMSLCKHNIIANSSFGWWGAWLNQNPNKTVIAPKNWFHNSPYNETDIIPESWIKM